MVIVAQPRDDDYILLHDMESDKFPPRRFKISDELPQRKVEDQLSFTEEKSEEMKRKGQIPPSLLWDFSELKSLANKRIYYEEDITDEYLDRLISLSRSVDPRKRESARLYRQPGGWFRYALHSIQAAVSCEELDELEKVVTKS